MNRKNIFLALTIIAPITCAERPPQPTKLPWETEATQNSLKLRQRLTGLPAEIQREVLNTYFYQAYPNLRAMAQRIIEFKDKVTIGSMLQLLENLRTANAIDLGQRLKELPIMHSQKIVEWLNAAQKKLKGGETLHTQILSLYLPGMKEQFLDSFNEKNLGINYKTDYGSHSTPLIRAVSRDNIDAVKKLLSVAANPDLQDKEGWTPLMHAVGQGNTELIELLLAAGANPTLKSIHGNNAVKVAEAKKHPQIIPRLEKAILEWNAQQEKK